MGEAGAVETHHTVRHSLTSPTSGHHQAGVNQGRTSVAPLNFQSDRDLVVEPDIVLKAVAKTVLRDHGLAVLSATDRGRVARPASEHPLPLDREVRQGVVTVLDTGHGVELCGGEEELLVTPVLVVSSDNHTYRVNAGSACSRIESLQPLGSECTFYRVHRHEVRSIGYKPIVTVNSTGVDSIATYHSILNVDCNWVFLTKGMGDKVE